MARLAAEKPLEAVTLSEGSPRILSVLSERCASQTGSARSQKERDRCPRRQKCSAWQSGFALSPRVGLPPPENWACPLPGGRGWPATALSPAVARRVSSRTTDQTGSSQAAQWILATQAKDSPGLRLTCFVFNDIPHATRKCFCSLRHSSFVPKLSTRLLCFHGHSRFVPSVLENSFCFGVRQPSLQSCRLASSEAVDRP